VQGQQHTAAGEQEVGQGQARQQAQVTAWPGHWPGGGDGPEQRRRGRGCRAHVCGGPDRPKAVSAQPLQHDSPASARHCAHP